MSDAYLGPAAERVLYTGLLYNIPGQVCGEIPDFPDIVAHGYHEDEVKATLQGLLEEHVEAMLEDDEVLPEPQFRRVNDITLSADMTKPRTTSLYVSLPSTISKCVSSHYPSHKSPAPALTSDLRRSLLSTAADSPPACRTGAVRTLCFNAVILKTLGSFGGHFPDLPGAFTSGKSVEETRSKLQELLEFYIGGLLKNGIALPEPKFKDVAKLEMSESELRESPLVCMVSCTVEVQA